MPFAVNAGALSTETIISNTANDVRRIDMDEDIKYLDSDYSQFTTMLMQLPQTDAIREKVNWIEHDLFPRLSSLTAAATSADTALSVPAGEASYFRVNDLVRNMVTGEAYRVTGATAGTATTSIQVARAVSVSTGGVAAAPSASGAQLLIIGNAATQGAAIGDMRVRMKVLNYNFTQIFRLPYGFTGTETKIDQYYGREPMNERADKAVEFKRAMEYSLFWGARSFDGTTDPTKPRGTSGGLIEFIATNKWPVNGALSATALDTYLRAGLQHGSKKKVFFISPVIAQAISNFSRTGMGSQFEAPDGGKTFGVQVDGFISGAYGSRVPLVVKRDWNDFSTTLGYGGVGFLVDMEKVRLRPMRERQTKLLTGRAPNDVDSIWEEYLAEYTLQVSNEATHGVLTGVTG